jgi:hypothetical protein
MSVATPRGGTLSDLQKRVASPRRPGTSGAGSASDRADRADDSKTMSDPTISPSSRPIEAESSGVASFVRSLVPLALVACAVVSFFPGALRRLLPGFHEDPTPLRMIAVGALFFYTIANAVVSQRRRTASLRASFANFAARSGGQVEDRPLRGTPSGWEGGLRVAYRVAGLAAVLDQQRAKGSASSYRLAADVVLRRDFQFQILPGGAASRFLFSKSFMLPVLTMAIKASASSRGAAAGAPAAAPVGEALLERIGYIASDPVTTGDETFDQRFLVKASDPSVGRSLASDSSVRAALASLRERAPGFQAGLESLTSGGPGRVTIDITPPNPDGDTFAAMDAVLRALLAALEKLDVLSAA